VSLARASGLLAVIALVVPVEAQPAAEATLTVQVAGLRNARGKLSVSLYRDANGFPETPAKALRRQTVDIPRTLTAEAVFRGLAPGVYAVAVLHDENANGKLDKNFIGVPKEGYGASNDPRPARRPPTFAEAKFTLGGPAQTLAVKPLY
jgi:uncharacterized protein (DUF2141 family)